MDSEEAEYMKRQLRIYSAGYKFKERLKVLFLSKTEIKKMNETLLEEAKPLFYASHHANTIIDKLSKYYYEERIKTLPKTLVYELYSTFEELKKAKGKSYEESALWAFITLLNLSYSLNGWFLEKVFDFARQNPEYRKEILSHVLH